MLPSRIRGVVRINWIGGPTPKITDDITIALKSWGAKAYVALPLTMLLRMMQTLMS